MYDSFDPIKVSSMNHKDLKNLIQMGEGTYLEFKKRTPTAAKIAREMAAFANGDGGTLLVGVSDSGEITGVEAFFEEEFLLQKAARELCDPVIELVIELVHTPEGDVMVIRVPESEIKPVYIRGKRGRLVFVRSRDESVLASEERVDILRNETSGEGVTFEYGDNEQKLFRYLNEYGEITVQKYSHLINVTTWRSSRILVNLVSAGILHLSRREQIDYFTFSTRNRQNRQS